MRISLTVLALVAIACDAPAQLFDWNGSLDLSAVQAEIQGVDQETFQQRYTVNVTRDLTDVLRARASYRYFKFDIDAAEQLGVFREESQPSAEISWNHRLWHASVTGQQRRVRTQGIDGHLITNSFVADWKTTPSDWPIFGLRYDWSEVGNDGDVQIRNTRDARLVGTVDVRRDHETFDYTFTRRSSSNLLRDLNQRELTHQVRYVGSHDLDAARRWRLDSQYLFTRSDRVDEVRRGSSLLEEVTVARALFAVDPGPELGELESVPGLVDGNTSVATLPLVEIGAGSIDRNIGADLGLVRTAIGGVFLYVDRISSESVTWEVYSSEDGLDWELQTSTPVRRFDPAFQRYEIEFTPFAGRYVKVVNGGVNEAAAVVVTEIEIFESIQQVGEVERDATTHFANANVRWRATDDVDASLSGSMRFEPQQGSLGDRESYDYAMRSRWRQTEHLQWTGRWEQSWQRFGEARPHLRDDVLSATMLYDPLATLGTSTSATYRRSIEGGRDLRTVRGLFGSVDAQPISTLDIVVDALVSRLDDPLADRTSDIWSVRSSLDAEVTRSLNVLGSWSHQETRIDPTDELVIRRIWTLDVDLQFTERLFARIGTTWVEDQRFSRRQDYLLNWRVGPRLVLTGQLVYDDATGGFRTDRASFSATFDVNRRTTAYLRYAEIEQGIDGEERTMSWQQGVRMAF